MKAKDKKVDVIFLIYKEEDDNDVFAYFPNENYYSKGNIGYGGVTADNWQDMKTCYAHLGQHSSCHVDYAKECKEANYNEYSDLLKELIGQRYNNLRVLNSQTFEAHRQPTKAEIKFGEGAIHYRDFPLADWLNKKGEIKKWIVASNDNLRYYR